MTAQPTDADRDAAARLLDRVLSRVGAAEAHDAIAQALADARAEGYAAGFRDGGGPDDPSAAEERAYGHGYEAGQAAGCGSFACLLNQEPLL